MITLLLSSLKSCAKVQLIIDIDKEKGIYLARIRFSCNIISKRKRPCELSQSRFRILQYVSLAANSSTSEALKRLLTYSPRYKTNYSAITAYCMVAIVEHDLKLHRSTYEVLRILSASLLDKTPIKELFTKEPEYVADDGQLTLNFI